MTKMIFPRNNFIVFKLAPVFDKVEYHQHELKSLIEATKIVLLKFLKKRVLVDDK